MCLQKKENWGLWWSPGCLFVLPVQVGEGGEGPLTLATLK